MTVMRDLQTDTRPAYGDPANKGSPKMKVKRHRVEAEAEAEAQGQSKPSDTRTSQDKRQKILGHGRE